MFKKKFKENVKNKLMRTEIEIENFKLLIVETIRFDDMLYNRVIKKKFENSRKRFEIYAKENFRTKHFYFKKSQRFVEIILMKLNITVRRKEKNLKIKRSNINKKTCYNCDKLNYFVQNCQNCIMLQKKFNFILKKTLNKKK